MIHKTVKRCRDDSNKYANKVKMAMIKSKKQTKKGVQITKLV